MRNCISTHFKGIIPEDGFLYLFKTLGSFLYFLHFSFEVLMFNCSFYKNDKYSG